MNKKSFSLLSFKKIRQFVIDTIFPIECFGCKQEGVWICEKCFDKIPYQKKQKCLYCEKEEENGFFCAKCQKKYSPKLKAVLVAGDYNNEVLAKIIKHFKYKNGRDLKEVLGKYLKNFLITNDLYKKGRGFVLIPVPLHKKREKQRGYNQAFLLCQELTQIKNITINNHLKRTVHKKPQAKLNREQRLTNLKNAFSWQGDNLMGLDILLIDDVITTGATLNECAKVLKKAGAGNIYSLVLAHG